MSERKKTLAVSEKTVLEWVGLVIVASGYLPVNYLSL